MWREGTGLAPIPDSVPEGKILKVSEQVENLCDLIKYKGH